MGKIIYKFVIKNVRGRRRKVGVVLATDRNNIGWALCNFKQGDEFNKQTALDLALRRAQAMDEVCPTSLLDDYAYMADRAVKYFKK